MDVSFLKKVFGFPNKPEGTSQVYEVSKDVINKYMSRILPLPSFAQLKQLHPKIPDDHLAVLMYSSSDIARSMPETGENQAMELAMNSCAAYDQGRLMVTESSWSYHLMARIDKTAGDV
jgi:hypothetical protein